MNRGKCMNDIIVKDEVVIEKLIYEIRGKQVMLDSDLAKLYGTQTKRINEAVSRNKEKFPERFSWILDNYELEILRSQIATSSSRGGRRYGIRVFTEQGIAMLATILKTNVATKISISIMDAFVSMRKYISNNLIEQKYINNMVIEHDSQIKLLQESLEKKKKKRKVNEIYFNGQIYDAYSKILEIFKQATKTLTIIDAYADTTILDMIKRLNVEVVIITKDNHLLTQQDITKYNEQYHNLKVYYDHTFHDRYFILDEKEVYHCGASINRIGYKTFSITLIGDNDVGKSLMEKLEKLYK